MRDFLEKTYLLFINFFKQLTAAKKISFVVVGVAIVLGLAVIVVWASQSTYATLYNDLNKEDAKQIAVILEDERIPYQMNSDASEIKIPKEQVEKWRLQLAMSGVNFTGTVGYEVFDNQSFGTTSFVQRINKQRALEGELVKTIKHLKGILRARVHLTIPESSPFVAQKEPPTASIVVDLDRNVTLSPEEVKGIASLVASAVEGMRAEAVVILDGRGKKLSENNGDSMAESTANMIALENRLNKKYEKQVEEILGKVVGDGGVVAKVSAKLDFSESNTTETSFDSENAAVLSEVRNQQTISGSRPSPQGIPGARSNLPGELPQAEVAATRNDVNKEQSSRSWNVPSRVTKTNSPSAKIKNISVAVMVDGKKVPVLDASGNVVMDKDGKAQVNYEKWSDADLSNFAAIVTSSLGLDTLRGDSLVIKNMEFAQTDTRLADMMLLEQEKREFIRNLAKYFAIGFVISLFFFFVVRPFIKWVTDNTIESIEDFLPKTLEELEKVQVNQKLPGLEEAYEVLDEPVIPEKMESNILKEKIAALVMNNPEKAAYLIHDMLHTEEVEKQVA